MSEQWLAWPFGAHGAPRAILFKRGPAGKGRGDMMVAVIVLMLVGAALSALIWRLQAHLLRWQQHDMAE